MSIRYGMDAVPGKIVSVSFNEGKKELCFVIEDIGGRRLPVSYNVDEEMVLPDRVLTGIMLKESDVPEGHDINLDLIAECIHRVNGIAVFARDNNMEKEFNTLMTDCGFLQETDPSITFNEPDTVMTIKSDSGEPVVADSKESGVDEYYDTAVFSTTETTFISDCVGYPKTRITPKDDEWDIEITFATRRFGNTTVNVLLPNSYSPAGIIDSINSGVYCAVEENTLFKVDLNLFTK